MKSCFTGGKICEHRNFPFLHWSFLFLCCSDKNRTTMIIFATGFFGFHCCLSTMHYIQRVQWRHRGRNQLVLQCEVIWTGVATIREMPLAPQLVPSPKPLLHSIALCHRGQENGLIMTNIWDTVTLATSGVEISVNVKMSASMNNDVFLKMIMINMIKQHWILMNPSNKSRSCGVTWSLKNQVPKGNAQLDLLAMSMLLHIYKPRRFHRTWDAVNISSSCGVTASTRIWVTDGNFQNGSIPMTMPLPIYRPSFIEPKEEQICPAVVELQHLQKFGSPRIWVPDKNSQKGPIPMTMPLPIYGPVQFHGTWDAVNRSSDCEVTVYGIKKKKGYSVRKNFGSRRECPEGPNGMTMPFNICGPRWFHWTWNGGNQPRGWGVTAYSKYGWMDGQRLFYNPIYFPLERY